MYLFILEHSLLYIITLLTSTVLLCRVFIIYRKWEGMCVRRKRRKEKEKERKKKRIFLKEGTSITNKKKVLSFLINIIQPIKMSLFLQSHSYTLCNQSKWNTTTFIFSNNTFFFFFWERIIKRRQDEPDRIFIWKEVRDIPHFRPSRSAQPLYYLMWDD